MVDAKPILKINNLSMQFGGIKALKNISFEIVKNSISALIGPNGAGKTTLFNCLTGFYRASKGELLFHPDDQLIKIHTLLGEPLKWRLASHPKELVSCLFFKMFGGSHLAARAGIARTFQNIRLFREMTVIENLLIAQHMSAKSSLFSSLMNTKHYQKWEKGAIHKAYEWLEKFDIANDANRIAGTLPYGKQKHLEIARAMCTDPILLCLDEPAAGLNPHEADKLSQLILNLRSQYHLTILLIEHDMSVVMNISDQIIVLDGGEIIAKGKPQEIQKNQRVIDAYLGIDHA